MQIIKLSYQLNGMHIYLNIWFIRCDAQVTVQLSARTLVTDHCYWLQFDGKMVFNNNPWQSIKVGKRCSISAKIESNSLLPVYRQTPHHENQCFIAGFACFFGISTRPSTGVEQTTLTQMTATMVIIQNNYIILLISICDDILASLPDRQLQKPLRHCTIVNCGSMTMSIALSTGYVTRELAHEESNYRTR